MIYAMVIYTVENATRKVEDCRICADFDDACSYFLKYKEEKPDMTLTWSGLYFNDRVADVMLESLYLDHIQ